MTRTTTNNLWRFQDHPIPIEAVRNGGGMSNYSVCMTTSLLVETNGRALHNPRSRTACPLHRPVATDAYEVRDGQLPR